MLLSEQELSTLLRGFYVAYRERFEEVAPTEDPPMPLLSQQALDLVVVNGGRALHFFFTAPDKMTAMMQRRVTRLHDVSVWPAETEELKALVEESPEKHREQVRRTAEIDEAVYVHFVVWPEDGQLEKILREVAARLAEREVKRAAGEDVGEEEPSVLRREPLRAEDTDDWFHPAP